MARFGSVSLHLVSPLPADDSLRTDPHAEPEAAAAGSAPEEDARHPEAADGGAGYKADGERQEEGALLPEAQVCCEDGLRCSCAAVI